MCIFQFCKDRNDKINTSTYASVKTTSETETETDLSEIETNANDTINIDNIKDISSSKRKIIRCCICLKPMFGWSCMCVWHLCIGIVYLMWVLRKEFTNGNNMFSKKYILITVLWFTFFFTDYDSIYRCNNVIKTELYCKIM